MDEMFRSVLYTIITFLLYGFGIYILISILRFMKQKNRHDREIMKKIDELIKLSKEK